jgi:DNA-binding LytR/AlgR family response regulator
MIQALIVDDEPRAHKVIEHYIAKTSLLKLTGNCMNALEAADFLKNKPVDVLFLDITMPEIDGFALLRSIEKPPPVIFTTAHSAFALESYDYNAIDYLKKPIPYDRFLKAIDRLLNWQKKMKTTAMNDIIENIGIKVDGAIKKIPITEIVYVQSFGNYVKIFLGKKMVLAQMTTQEIEDLLPSPSFLRVHKSYIVNRSKIIGRSDEALMLDGLSLPIGKTYKKYVKAHV